MANDGIYNSNTNSNAEGIMESGRWVAIDCHLIVAVATFVEHFAFNFLEFEWFTEFFWYELISDISNSFQSFVASICKPKFVGWKFAE